MGYLIQYFTSLFDVDGIYSFDGTLMVYPFTSRSNDINCPNETYGFPLDVFCMFIVCLLGNPWEIPGKSMGNPWEIHWM